jgi:nucleotide-binding universal stress UspA family protein
MSRRSGFRTLVVGVDRSPHSRRALAFVARLAPAPAGRAVVVHVVEAVRSPSTPLVPASVRGHLVGEVKAVNESRKRAAQRLVDAAASQLTKVGWRARGEVRVGVPAPELLRAVDAARADLVVIGARGTGGVARFLLGSVAETVLRRAPVSVLTVK